MEVYRHEADYFRLAREQGLYHLLPEHQNRDAFAANASGIGQVNGITPPSSEREKSVAEGSPGLANGVCDEEEPVESVAGEAD